jgi:hypothetical protein
VAAAEAVAAVGWDSVLQLVAAVDEVDSAVALKPTKQNLCCLNLPLLKETAKTSSFLFLYLH